MLSEVFWVAFISTSAATLIKCFAMLYKSKCKKVKCCCIKIIRDLDAEAEAESLELRNIATFNQQRNTSSSPRVNIL